MLVKRMLPKQKTVRTIPLSLQQFYDRRNRVLIIRSSRGLGDILMHRMIFEDFKKLMPDMHLTFACQPHYHDVVRGHPFLDAVVDCNAVNRENYMVSYDTSQCCIFWESAKAPHADKNRADIWAEHCGVKLTTHDMHVPFISQDMIQFGDFQVKQAKGMSTSIYKKDSPNVLLAPIAYEPIRSLPKGIIAGAVEYLRARGCFVYSTHHEQLSILDDLGVPVLKGYKIPQWFSFIHAADYVVSVDTSVFHYAGGIKKPLVGVFTHVDGKYRGQYYDFVLVQKHRDNGDWPCGPCYNYTMCTHPKGKGTGWDQKKPCWSELTLEMVIEGIEKMFARWPK